jgi:hypothetical protein
MCVIVFLGKAHTCGMQTQKKSYNYIMLNSQHRIAIKKITHPKQPCYYFFYCSRAEDSQRFPKLPCKHEFIFMPSHSVQSKAKPAAALLRRGGNLLFFLIDEVLKMFYKLKPWACNAVAIAASSFIL